MKNPMPRNNPSHPGEIVRQLCLDPLELSIAEAAKGLGVSVETLEDLVEERASMTSDMALRLAKAFGSTPETWLRIQFAYDLADTRRRTRRTKVRDFRAGVST